MATQIISQAIIQHPEDPAVQMSLVRAEIKKQNANREAEQREMIKELRKHINAEDDYMRMVRSSRNRLLADRTRNLKREKHRRRKEERVTISDIADAISRPLVLVWALFWLLGEKLGLWKLRRGRQKGSMPIPTRRGVRVYFIVGIALNICVWYICIRKLIAYIHFING